MASRTAANGNGSRPGRNGKTKAVVLAGGRGTRLAPYTSVLPKPLMPVGERAILELVVDQLESCGIKDITFCVGYLAHLIQSVFDNRENGHVSIEYVHEHEALGTAAPLKLVDGLDSTFLVMNGDVLTELDYRDLIRYHQEHGNMLTIATRSRAIKVDYGILHLDVMQRVRDFEEKPEITTPVSMGIYVMEPEVLEHIPENQYFDFPHLVETMLEAGLPIGSYRYDGLWFDIGRQEDYEEAVSAWAAADGGDMHANTSRSTTARTRKVRSNRSAAEPRAHVFEAEQQRRAVALGRRRQRQTATGSASPWSGTGRTLRPRASSVTTSATRSPEYPLRSRSSRLRAPKGRTARPSAPSAPSPPIRRSSWLRSTGSPTCSTCCRRPGSSP